MKLVLVVPYRTPSLNVTKRQHWTVQGEEKYRAMSALLSALSDAASNPLTRTTSPEASKICSTASGTLASYLVTNRGGLNSKRNSGKFKVALRRKH